MVPTISQVEYAINSNDTKLMQQFINDGLDVNYKLEKGALIFESWFKRRFEMVELLIENGADIPNTINTGNTFIKHLKILYDGGFITRHTPDVDEKSKKYITSFDFQYKLYLNNPLNVIELKKYNLLNEELEKITQHIILASEMNIL